MFEVKVKIKGFKGFVKTLVRTEAKAIKMVNDANEYHWTSATYSRLW